MRDIRAAEGVYSVGRLKSVADEWHAEFPNLHLFARSLLSGVAAQGQLRALVTDSTLEDRCISLCGRNLPNDDLAQVCAAILEAQRPCSDLIFAASSVFFRVGIIAVKLAATEGFVWSAETGRRLDASELDEDTNYRIHPMFYRSLGIEPQSG